MNVLLQGFGMLAQMMQNQGGQAPQAPQTPGQGQLLGMPRFSPQPAIGDQGQSTPNSIAGQAGGVVAPEATSSDGNAGLQMLLSSLSGASSSASALTTRSEAIIPPSVATETGQGPAKKLKKAKDKQSAINSSQIATVGTAWDRFVFNCGQSIDQSHNLLKDWSISGPRDWLREPSKKLEAKGEDDGTRYRKIQSSNTADPAVLRQGDLLGLFEVAFTGVCALNDLFSQYRAKQTLSLGDVTLAEVTRICTALNANQSLQEVWENGAWRPLLQQQMEQELKLAFTSREEPLCVPNMIAHMSSDASHAICSDRAVIRYPTEYMEFMPQADRKPEALRSFWCPGKFQYRLWAHALRMLMTHAVKDRASCMKVFHALFKHPLKKELELVFFADPSVQTLPAVQVEGEASDSDGDVDFINIDDEAVDALDAEVLGTEDKAAAVQAKFFILPEVIHEAKLACSLIWPFHFLEELDEALAVAEAPTGTNPFIQALGRFDLFNSFKTDAKKVGDQLKGFQKWCEDHQVTFTAFDKLAARTRATALNFHPKECHGSDALSVISWDQDMKWQSISKASKAMQEFGLKYTDPRLHRSAADDMSRRLRAFDLFLQQIPLLCQRLVLGTLVAILKLPKGTVTRVPMLDAAVVLELEVANHLNKLEVMDKYVVDRDPVSSEGILFKERFQKILTFHGWLVAVAKAHVNTFEPLIDSPESEISSESQETYQDMSINLRKVLDSMKPSGELHWATSAPAADGGSRNPMSIGGGFFKAADLAAIGEVTKLQQATNCS